MKIKALFARHFSASKGRNAAMRKAAAACDLVDCSSPRQNLHHLPYANENENLSTEVFLQGNECPHFHFQNGQSPFQRVIKPVVSRTKRIVRRARSLFSCIISQPCTGMDAPEQQDIPEVEIARKELSPSLCSDGEYEKAVIGDDEECQSAYRPLREYHSVGGSEERVILTQRKEPFRYYHKLPCEEDKPRVAQGTVNRLSLRFEQLAVETSSPNEFLTPKTSTQMCDVRKGEAKDEACSETPIHEMETSQVDPCDMPNETPSTGCTGNEEERPAESVSQDVDKKWCGKVSNEFTVAPQIPLQKASSNETLCENGFCSPATSVDSMDRSFIIPPENDVTPVVGELFSENKDKTISDMRPRVVTFHESVELAEKAKHGKRNEADDNADDEASERSDEDFVMYRQVSFRSDEDYCTPIIEFELKDIGCGFQ